jgi:hypothetical protein
MPWPYAQQTGIVKTKTKDTAGIAFPGGKTPGNPQNVNMQFTTRSRTSPLKASS